MRDIAASRLVPDWLRIGPEGLSPARGFSSDAGYEAIRVPSFLPGLAKRATRRFSTGGCGLRAAPPSYAAKIVRRETAQVFRLQRRCGRTEGRAALAHACTRSPWSGNSTRSGPHSDPYIRRLLQHFALLTHSSTIRVWCPYDPHINGIHVVIVRRSAIGRHCTPRDRLARGWRSGPGIPAETCGAELRGPCLCVSRNQGGVPYVRRAEISTSRRALGRFTIRRGAAALKTSMILHGTQRPGPDVCRAHLRSDSPRAILQPHRALMADTDARFSGWSPPADHASSF